jgi:hypothetical protein
MMDRPPSKKPRSHIDTSHLSLADRQAFERVASILNKPLSELYEDNPHNKSMGTRRTVDIPRVGDVAHTELQSWAVPTTQWEAMNSWQQGIGGGEIDDYVSVNPNRPWTGPSEAILTKESPIDLAFNQWTDTISQTPAMRIGSRGHSGDSGILDQVGLRRSPSWSHEATAEEPWVGVPTDFLTQTSLQDKVIDDTELATLLQSTGGERSANSSAVGTQDDRSALNAHCSRQGVDLIDRTSSRLSSSTSSDLLDGDENGALFEQEWEDLEMPQGSGSGSQLASSAETTISGWSLIELTKAHDCFEKTSHLDNSNSKFVKWIPADSSSKEPSSQRPQRRGPFQDQQLREETSSTRKLKACVRCRMQKIRVSVHYSTPLNSRIDQYSAKSTPTTQTVFAGHVRPSPSRKSTRFHAFGTSSQSARFIASERPQDWNLPLGGQ